MAPCSRWVWHLVTKLHVFAQRSCQWSCFGCDHCPAGLNSRQALLVYARAWCKKFVILSQVAAQGQPAGEAAFQRLLNMANELRTMVDSMGRTWTIMREFVGDLRAHVVYKREDA